MSFVSQLDLEQRDFHGFVSIARLRYLSLHTVPALQGGVYVVVRLANTAPCFLAQSPAGRTGGRNPTITIARLQARWVEGTCVLYFGKADGGMRSSLQHRIRTYLRHGGGQRAAHWGGRAIWQLADAENLSIGWRITARGRPRDEEAQLLDQFVDTHHRLPFANLRR